MDARENQIELLNLDKISPLGEELILFLISLSKNTHVEGLIIFGSRAIGDFEPYSDLDLAVDAPNIFRLEWLKLKEYATYDLRTLIKISLVHYSTNPNKLKERIVKNGIVIYGR